MSRQAGCAVRGPTQCIRVILHFQEELGQIKSLNQDISAYTIAAHTRSAALNKRTHMKRTHTFEPDRVDCKECIPNARLDVLEANCVLAHRHVIHAAGRDA